MLNPKSSHEASPLSDTINQLMRILDEMHNPVGAYFAISVCREAIRTHYTLTQENIEAAEQAASKGIEKWKP